MASEDATTKNVGKVDSLFSGSDSSSSDSDHEEAEQPKTTTGANGNVDSKPAEDATKKADDMDDLFGSGTDDDDDDDSSSDDSDNETRSTVNTRTGTVSSNRNETKDSSSNSSSSNNNVDRPVENLFLPPRFELPGDINLLRTSRLVGIQTKVYDTDNFDETSEKAWNTDDHGNKRYLNVIRWRYKKNKDGSYALNEGGDKIAESNARIITWSDGTRSIQIGKEILDIDLKPLARQHHWVYKQVMNKPPDGEPDTVLECAGDYVKSRWSVKPSSVNSKSHKDLVRLQQKTRANKRNKQATIARTVTITDPEKDDEDRWRAEEKEIQALERQRRKVMKVDRYDEYANSGALSANYLEEDNDSDSDEEEEWDAKRTAVDNSKKPSRAERAAQRNAAKEDAAEEEEEEEDVDTKEKEIPSSSSATTTTTTTSTTTAKRPLEEGGGGSDDDDDDDDDDGDEMLKQPVRKKQKVTAKILDDDDDDDDDDD
jgi:hypothetical protein